MQGVLSTGTGAQASRFPADWNRGRVLQLYETITEHNNTKPKQILINSNS